MSHFVVLVTLPKGTRNIPLAVMSALEPYDENKKVELFMSETADDIKKKRTDDITDLKERLANKKIKDETWAKKRIEELENMTDQEFYEDYVDGSLRDENGNIMSSHNPEGRWDWWVIGGRWGEFLDLKNGKTADFAKVKDVRFEPTEDEIEKTGERYERLKKADSMKKQGIELDEDIEIEYLFSEFDPAQSKEDFIKEESAISFYSCVDKNGEWHERAECGWFGSEHNVTEETGSWRLKFKERFIDPLDPNDILVVVDCHT
jgi:hypothetical protein